MRKFMALCTAVFLAASPSDARADSTPYAVLPTRPVTMAWDKSMLRVNVAYRDVVDERVTKKLASGLPTVIALRAYLLEEGESMPIALAVKSCRVVFDLWDEVYRIHLSTPSGDRDTASLQIEGVLRQCAEAKDLAIVERSKLRPGKSYFIAIAAEANPVSPEMVEQMRKWVTRPAGSTGIGPGDALFGSFVSLFVKQIGAADKTVRFRTTRIPE